MLLVKKPICISVTCEMFFFPERNLQPRVGAWIELQINLIVAPPKEKYAMCVWRYWQMYLKNCA